ncbi:hypothetical protein D0T50_06915 [Bacteroides sp. 214]|uniref:hypothetical protein n=1 Tax=Bacteroides sp. 214 TaxID=2302935 RepID=UPI0013D59476|nr:hypothetical protein [Bacteroides sp. 214]NDW12619.1 hypothetical protein [Bacteroides sp. 214]
MTKKGLKLEISVKETDVKIEAKISSKKLQLMARQMQQIISRCRPTEEPRTFIAKFIKGWIEKEFYYGENNNISDLIEHIRAAYFLPQKRNKNKEMSRRDLQEMLMEAIDDYKESANKRS